MKILFQSRADLFKKRGGDTIQMEALRDKLKDLGVEVDINLSTEPDLKNYDLVNVFNLDWCRDSYLQAVNAKLQGKKIVLSAIHHSFEEMDKYERLSRFGIRRLTGLIAKGWLGQEYLKEIYRAVCNPKRIRGTLTQFSLGIKKQQVLTLKASDLVIVQTEKEAEDIYNDFGVDIKTRKVVNGVDKSFADADPENFIGKYNLSGFILCVGRIEPRKNQLLVIDAVSKIRSGSRFKDLGLVFIGRNNWNHMEYILRVKDRIRKNSWITHIPYIPYKDMSSAYAASKVSINASWFETTGLVSLEALLSGTRVVASGARAKEYLGDYAFYCEPDKIDSIISAINKALKRDPDPRAKDYILKNYTWDIAAKQSIEAYKEVLEQ